MPKLEDLIVSSTASLKTAMEKMTRNQKGVLFVCDSERLLGVISDGDIRRGLLNNILMTAPVNQIMNVDPVTSQTAKEAEKILISRPVLAVPVVSKDGLIQEVLLQESGKTVSVKSGTANKQVKGLKKPYAALAIIPARAGSKRIPRKNLQTVGGKPLLAWAILAAKSSQNITRTLISTDHEEIASVAKKFGAEAPWLRPACLAGDHSKTLDVVLHALEWALKEYEPKPEYGILLEPTAPLRNAGHIDRALALLAESQADSVVSVCEVPHVFHPEEVLSLEEGLIKPYLAGRTMDSRKLRAEQSPVYILSGHVYAFKISSVLKYKSLYGKKCVPLLVDWDSYLDVDTPEDLRVADLKLRQMNAGDKG